MKHFTIEDTYGECKGNYYLGTQDKPRKHKMVAIKRTRIRYGFCMVTYECVFCGGRTRSETNYSLLADFFTIKGNRS